MRLYREREIIKHIEANIKRSEAHRVSDELIDAPNSGQRVELGSRQPRVLTSRFVELLPHAVQSFQQQLQIFLYENVVLGREARRMPSVRNLPSIQGTYVRIVSENTYEVMLTNSLCQVIPYRLLRVAYVSLLDSRDGLDVMRVTPTWFGAGPRLDFAIVKDSEDDAPWFAQILSIFVLDFNGTRHRLAYTRRFHTCPRRSKLTGYIELKDRGEFSFIFVDSIVRSCVVLSPGVHSSRLVVGDLTDADMYLRLLDVI